MAYDAVILAGGRSKRLGGTPKALLLSGGRTLLETTLAAVPAAEQICVAGPADLAADVFRSVPDALLVREEPAFAGPAAAVAAGVRAMSGGQDWTLVLACDMPRVSEAVQALLAAAADASTSLLAVDEDGFRQPLAGLYRSAELRSAVELHGPGELENMSMKSLLARVQWRGVAVPPMSTADVDTWADARSLGVSTGDAP